MFFSEEIFTEGSSDAAFRRVLLEILKAPKVEAVTTGAEKVRDSDTTEQLAYRFEISNPRHRIVANEVFSLNLPVAVARFVWMISGNNRLADIAFYEPRVRQFTDDEIIVPGSSYGARIRQAHPGIDQLQGVIARLKEDKNSRRAAIAIYQPTDTVRNSNDIPCAFGMFFHIRNEKLHTQVIMRSNNATTLLPFNIFEFSLLAEVVAAECNVDMAQLSHYAASMHVYEKMRELSEKIVSAGGETKSVEMPQMPSDPAPLDEIRRLVHFEADMRHRSEAISDGTIEEEVEKIRAEFSTYWQQMAFLLLATVVNQRCSKEGANSLKAAMDPNLAKLVKWSSSGESEGTFESSDLPLLDVMQKTDNIVTLHRTKTGASFRQRAVEYEQAAGERFSADELLEMQERIVSRLAARGLEVEVSKSDFAAILADVRDKK
ncbi:thymidylate synthase [Roseibium sp. Sym1]|uniref:thymidylate synthase n=1 Tax=Roseibium sp. Sym1 TaxID=3016006 RepID=UPI0022B2DB3B|nr:thymidylate synthase [Roseibium sp. Sym1]